MRTFVCDVHIPPSLVTALRAKGFEAGHAYHIGLGTADDETIWNYARERDAIIVTKDNDFAKMSARLSGPLVVLVCLGNCTNKKLLAKFFEALPAILAHFDGGARLVELG
jgi:predicted nuclease of predicted toxin-antitoxin system